MTRSNSRRAAAVIVSLRLFNYFQAWTYEAEGEDAERADSVEEHAYAKNVDMLRRHYEVPQEISASEGLNQA